MNPGVVIPIDSDGRKILLLEKVGELDIEPLKEIAIEQDKHFILVEYMTYAREVYKQVQNLISFNFNPAAAHMVNQYLSMQNSIYTHVRINF